MNNSNERFCEPCFEIRDSELARFRDLPASFGFNGFGEVIFYRTYSRLKEDGSRENWWEVVRRVINGCFSIRKYHCLKNGLPWNENAMQRLAGKFGYSMYQMHFLPPGRGLWACGTDFMYDRGSMALNNCAAVNVTELNFSVPWIMDCLMCGVGVGFRINWKLDITTGEGLIVSPPKEASVFVIEDSREGWVDSIRVLIDSYLPKNVQRHPLRSKNTDYDRTKSPVFDYSQVRKQGLPIKGFGGKASGPEPLRKLHNRMRVFFEAYLVYVQQEFSEYKKFLEHQLQLFETKLNLQAVSTALKSSTTSNNDSVIEELGNFEPQQAHYYITPENSPNKRKRVKLSNSENSNATFLNAIISQSTLETFYGYDWKESNFFKEFDIPNTWLKYKAGNCRVFEVGRKELLKSLVNLNAFYILEKSETNEGDVLQDSFRVDVDYLAQMKEKNLVDEEKIYTKNGTTSYYELYERLAKEEQEEVYSEENPRSYDSTRFIADLVNSIGVCVVAGNVRRSAEIAISNAGDVTFKHLKNYEMYPERQDIGWMSNNSCIFEKTEEFKKYIPDIVNSILERGEPGFVNLKNIQRFGRVGGHDIVTGSRETEPDRAVAANPCGEIPLESYELCNLAEVFPTRCVDRNGNFSFDIFANALKFATFYSSTVALLPTQYDVTNEVIARNRRIGVSLSGISLFYEKETASGTTSYLRRAYRIIREENKRLAKEAGVVESIRVTTVKPSGTISLLAGVPAGMHFPTFKYAIRRVRIAENSEIAQILQANGVTWEKDHYSENTLVFEFPIYHGEARDASKVSLWEQMTLLTMLQREWSDNMVSATITFKKKRLPEEVEKAKETIENFTHSATPTVTKEEFDQALQLVLDDKDAMSTLDLEKAIGTFSPLIKSCSLLPHSDTGAYKQMPYEGITREEYERRVKLIKPIDWSLLIRPSQSNSKSRKSDTLMPKFCDGTSCEL